MCLKVIFFKRTTVVNLMGYMRRKIAKWRFKEECERLTDSYSDVFLSRTFPMGYKFARDNYSKQIFVCKIHRHGI